MQGKLENGQLARQFALAGNARLTLVSEKTGTRFTYRVRAWEAEKAVMDGETVVRPAKVLSIVGLLRGADNNSDFTRLGTIHEDKRYTHSGKSPVSPDAPSAKGFAWAWRFIVKDELPPGCEVWHEGRCGKCGRALTVPESIATGLGPICADGGY